METEPKRPFKELGMILTQEWLEDSAFFHSREELQEFLSLEILHCILPQLDGDTDQFFEWTNGNVNIFISLHVEVEDHVNFTILFTENPD